MSHAEPVRRLMFHPYCRHPSNGGAHTDRWAGTKPATVRVRYKINKMNKMRDDDGRKGES